MNKFSANIRYLTLLFIATGSMCSAAELIDSGIKTTRLGIRIAEFSPTIPNLIGDIPDGKLLINQMVSLIPQIKTVADSFAPGASSLPGLLEQTMSAYSRKEYDKLGFSKIGVALETTIPQLMGVILQTYPFIYFFIEQIGRPILPLTMDIGTILDNSFIASFSRDTLTIINSGTIQEAYNIFNELDTLLSHELLPRMTDLLTEVDRALPQMAKLGMLK